jgi:hypothetical protein
VGAIIPKALVRVRELWFSLFRKRPCSGGSTGKERLVCRKWGEDCNGSKGLRFLNGRGGPLGFKGWRLQEKGFFFFRLRVLFFFFFSPPPIFLSS